MGFARRRLPLVAGLWLLCQLAGIAAAPVGFCCRGMQTIDDDKCCPGMLPGQVCPLHHPENGKQDAKKTCKMRSACAASDAALFSLAGGIGVLPPQTALVNAFVPGISLADLSSSPLSRAFVPESPPPRS